MKARPSTLLTLLVLSCPFLFSACGGGGGGSAAKSAVAADLGGDTGGTSASLDPSADPDGDGLDNAQELLYGTNPLLADTDGDGFSDFDEIVKFGFDPEIDPLRFNPLVADIPQLAVALQSVPVMHLLLTDTHAESRTFEVDRTEENAVTIDQSVTEIVQDAFDLSQTSSNATTFTGGVAGDTTISFDITKTMATSLEFDFTETQTVENVKAVTEIEAFSETHEIAASGGDLRVVASLANVGNVPFRIDHIVLSALIPDPFGSDKFFPVGNLVYDTSHNYTGYPPFTIPPGGVFPFCNFVNDVLDLEIALEVLKNEGELLITIASFELTDADGVPFAFKFTDIEARDALIVVDYAGLRNPEHFLVAANSDPNSPGITAGRALRDVLRLPFEAGTIDWGGLPKTGLLGVRDVRANFQNNSFWLAIQVRDDGLGKKATRFSIVTQDYDFENILLRGGDQLLLVYLQDQDGDGVFSRQEHLLGTSDLTADSDGDGWTDFYEVHTSHTNPTNPDTDGDGVIDSLDAAPLDPVAH